MLSDCKLVERFNRQDAWTVGAGSLQLHQVRIVETAHLTSLRLWVGREDFDVGNFIQYPLRVMGMELPDIRRKG